MCLFTTLHGWDTKQKQQSLLQAHDHEQILHIFIGITDIRIHTSYTVFFLHVFVKTDKKERRFKWIHKRAPVSHKVRFPSNKSNKQSHETIR